MKKTLLTVVAILFTVCVNAQSGMPKELTCTEEAFNFSFSVGTKWRFTPPKIGPVGASSYETDYIPAWSTRANPIVPETYPFATGVTHLQNNIPQVYTNSFKVIDKLKYTLPGINFNPTLNFNLLKPRFPQNPNQLVIY